MSDTKRDLENLKTEIAGLKARIRRMEYYFQALPNPQDFNFVEDSSDELFEEAKKIVRQYDRASASLLQRRLLIGYSRAARLLDQLEAAGVVGPAEGAKPRDVFKKCSKK
jgi:DNA segregation ATPase FtsK/SpoIIIE-like protein